MSLHEFMLTTAVYGLKADGGSFTHDQNIMMNMNYADPSDDFGHLAEGSLAIVKPDGRIIVDTIDPTLSSLKYVKYVIGRGADKAPWVSGKVTNDVRTSYSTPDGGTNFFAIVGSAGGQGDLNTPAVMQVGDSAGVSVHLTQNYLGLVNDSHTYTTIVREGDDHPALVARLVEVINAETQFKITATDEAGEGIGIECEEPVALSVVGVFENATIWNTDSPDYALTDGRISQFTPGINNIDNVRKLEEKSFAERGDTDGTSHQQYQTWKIVSGLDADEQYSVYTMSWELSPAAIGEAIRKVQGPSLAIAALIRSGGDVAVETNVDQIMVAVFGDAVAVEVP